MLELRITVKKMITSPTLPLRLKILVYSAFDTYIDYQLFLQRTTMRTTMNVLIINVYQEYRYISTAYDDIYNLYRKYALLYEWNYYLPSHYCHLCKTFIELKIYTKH